MIVRLPEDRMIIIDAKVPDLDAIAVLRTDGPDSHADSSRLHAQKLKTTIKDLAARNYPNRFSRSLDYVVLFLPAESLFSAALEGDRDLIVWAAQQRIMIATPASLIALLRSVSVSWQQYAQSENTRLIADSAKELYQRVVTFYEHVGDIGDALGKAGKAFNRAVGSYETRVRPTGERLLELKVDDTGKQLTDIKPVDEALRLPKN
jgi:DNA recombination protein RmuC